MTSPWLFQPKAVGASIVVNALTKYIGGPRQRARRQPDGHGPLRLDALSQHRTDSIAPANPAAVGHDADPQERAARLRRDARRRKRRITSRSARRRSRCAWSGSATTRGRWRPRSSADPRVSTVLLPGTPIASTACARRASCFAIRVRCSSFELDGAIDVFDFLNRLDVVIKSSNLGDNRTLAIPVAHTIYCEMGAQRRASMGIADSLIRISVGIEDTDDLIADFEQALGGATS